MSLTLTPTTPGLSAVSPPRITVIGVGGGGVNAVNNMINSQLRGVTFIAANTDAQQLASSKADIRIQLGPALTRGLGAGAKPDIGRQSTEEVEDEIRQHLEGVDLVFVTAGMGGGTGTGAAPVVARIAREVGALTIGVVSKPFKFEGSRRSRAADAGIAELEKYVDTLLVIPNQNLFANASLNTALVDAFTMADDVLYNGVRSVTDLMVETGYVNLDFADVRTVMGGMGRAMMGIGVASAEEDGEDWAITAAERAISNPLLEENSIKGARALLVNVTVGKDMGLIPFDQVMDLIRETADCDDGEINFGFVQNENMNGKVQVSVIATGLSGRMGNAAQPDAQQSQSIPPTPEDNAPHPAEDSPQPTAEDAAPAPTLADNADAPHQVEDSPHQIASSATTPNYTPPEREPLDVSRAQDENTQTGGGLFSRLFRTRPAPGPERKTPTTQERHTQPPPASEEDDLNIPTYLRRGPKS